MAPQSLVFELSIAEDGRAYFNSVDGSSRILEVNGGRFPAGAFSSKYVPEALQKTHLLTRFTFYDKQNLEDYLQIEDCLRIEGGVKTQEPIFVTRSGPEYPPQIKGLLADKENIIVTQADGKTVHKRFDLTLLNGRKFKRCLIRVKRAGIYKGRIYCKFMLTHVYL